MLIPACYKEDTFLEKVHSAPQGEGQFHLWWLGQSGFLLQWQGRHILLDPYLSDSLTSKYTDTDKPHIRMSELVIRPEKLDFTDIVTSSHNHTDHLDAETLLPLLRVNPALKMIIPEANRAFVAERIRQPQDFPIGLSDGERVEIDGFTFTGIPAAHNELERDEQGRCRFMGYVIQFGHFTVYHSGDTLWHEAVVEALRPYRIDLACLPINGHDPARRVAGNLNAAEAVRLGRLLKIKTIIPCHYDMFTFNTADPSEFARLAREAGQGFQVLRGGEGIAVGS